MIKKIYAVLSEKDFFDFRRRCYAEGMKMGEALTSIVHAYAKGAQINLKNFKVEKVHHEPTGVNYGGD